MSTDTAVYEKEYEYRWTHIPTGKHGVKTWHGMLRVQFEEALKIWNASQPDTWFYEEVVK